MEEEVSYLRLTFLGSPSDIAHEIEIWLHEEASDGFTCTLPFLPQGLEEVTDRLIPGLQRRGLFRTEYTGSTLREHFGLLRPENRFFSGVVGGKTTSGRRVTSLTSVCP